MTTKGKRTNELQSNQEGGGGVWRYSERNSAMSMNVIAIVAIVLSCLAIGVASFALCGVSHKVGSEFCMRVFISIVVAIAFFAVLYFAWYFMDGMMDVLKRGNRSQDCSSCTNVLHQSAITMNVSGVDNKVGGSELSVVAAYESLSNELSSWMAIMGIFATVFGLLLPIGSYLLQRQSLKDEKEGIMKELGETSERSRNDLLGIIDRTKAELSVGMFDRMKPMWRFLASNFDRFLVDDTKKIIAGTATPIDVVNFLIGFDVYLDCLVRAGNSGMLAEAIQKYHSVVDTVRNNRDLWQKVVSILKIMIQPSPDFVKGEDFAKLVGMRQYEWLKTLYDEIIPWKFAG